MTTPSECSGYARPSPSLRLYTTSFLRTSAGGARDQDDRNDDEDDHREIADRPRSFTNDLNVTGATRPGYAPPQKQTRSVIPAALAELRHLSSLDRSSHSSIHPASSGNSRAVTTGSALPPLQAACNTHSTRVGEQVIRTRAAVDKRPRIELNPAAGSRALTMGSVDHTRMQSTREPQSNNKATVNARCHAQVMARLGFFALPSPATGAENVPQPPGVATSSHREIAFG